MSTSTPPAEIQPAKHGKPDESRARLHRRLDELLDLHNMIAGSVAANEMSNATADLLQYRAEQLVIRAIHFAAEVAGDDARAIAFRHDDPCSREAFARFMNVVAGYAAPYAYATLDLGLQTFTWTDAMGILDDDRSLQFGDTPARWRPSRKLRPNGSKYPELCEKWRAVQWLAYLSGFVDEANLRNKYMATSAMDDVATFYGVSATTLRTWVRDTKQIEAGRRRERALEEARREGEAGFRPQFTRSPYDDETRADYKQWLGFDASYYKNLVNPGS